MRRKKNKYFKSIEEYREFYSNSPVENKGIRGKYYRMGIEAAKLASENTLRTVLKTLQ